MPSHHSLPALVLFFSSIGSVGRSPGFMKERQFLKSWMMLEKKKIKLVV